MSVSSPSPDLVRIARRNFYLPVTFENDHGTSSVPSSGTCLEIEIGAGTGDFAINYAKQFPNTNLIAIEHTNNRFRKFTAKLGDKPANLLPVHANAISWIYRNIEKESVNCFHLLYPNPYPKNKHLNKRWYAMPFMGVIINCLKPGGAVHIATNLAFYAEQAEWYFSNVWKLNLMQRKEITGIKTITNARTAFEKKYLANGQTCYDLIFSKTPL